MFVEIERDRSNSSDSELLNQLIVSDAIERRTETDAAGNFTFDPLPDGIYRLQPVDYQHIPGKGLIRRALPGVFAPQKVTIQEGRHGRADRDSRRAPRGDRGRLDRQQGQAPKRLGPHDQRPDRRRVLAHPGPSFGRGQVRREGPARDGARTDRHHHQRARLDATPDRQGRKARDRPICHARDPRPRRQGSPDHPLRRADRDRQGDRPRMVGRSRTSRSRAITWKTTRAPASVSTSRTASGPTSASNGRTTVVTVRPSSRPTAR